MAKKDVLVSSLVDSLNEKQWNLISQLLGREIAPTARNNLISKLFKKTIKRSSAKGKARNLQKWVCEQVSKLTGLAWGKDDDCEIRSRPMGQTGPDVIMSPKVRNLFPYTIECKNQETWNVVSYITQAKDNCYPETSWLVIMSRNGLEPVAVLDAKVFFDAVRKK